MIGNNCESCGFELQEDFFFCPGCGHDLQIVRYCVNCGHKIDKYASFCQECGSQLKMKQATESDGKKDATVKLKGEDTPSSEIKIEFPYSSSQTFDFAVEEAKKNPRFEICGEGKKAIYRVTFYQHEMEAAAGLAEHLKGWRTRTVYLDGDKTTWESVFAFLGCYNKKRASYKPEYYCFGYESDWQQNIWGCISSQLNYRDNEEWFCWGEFIDRKGTWRFDKKRIRHELEKNLYAFRFCPAFNQGRLETVLDAFPIIVNPTVDKNWKFAESWGDSTGLGLVVTVNRYGEKEEVKMKGVSPNGYGALEQIAKKLTFKLPLGVNK